MISSRGRTRKHWQHEHGLLSTTSTATTTTATTTTTTTTATTTTTPTTTTTTGVVLGLPPTALVNFSYIGSEVQSTWQCAYYYYYYLLPTPAAAAAAKASRLEKPQVLLVRFTTCLCVLAAW